MLRNHPLGIRNYPSCETDGQNTINHPRLDIYLSCGGSVEPEVCIPVEIGTYSPLTGTVDTEFSAGLDSIVGSPTITFTITSGTLPDGLSLDPVTGNISGTPEEFGTFSGIEVTATSSCGDTSTDTTTFELLINDSPEPPSEITIRWGNFLWADFPDPGPAFVAGDFTGSNADYLDGQTAVAATRVGTRTFADREGSRQVIWIADTLLDDSPTFLVSGLPWAQSLPEGTYYQLLTILGVPGHVYFSESINNSGYPLVIS